MALRVLLADESTTIKKVMQLALQDFAVDVKAVHSGLDVAEVARSFQPDIVFADVLLAKRNGYDVTAELKNDPNLGEIPVVLMWSSFMDIDEAAFARSKANSRLEKPFDVETLRTLVKEWVPKTQSQRLAHFLKFPADFVEPLAKEESQKQATAKTQQGAPGKVAPLAPAPTPAPAPAAKQPAAPTPKSPPALEMVQPLADLPPPALELPEMPEYTPPAFEETAVPEASALKPAAGADQKPSWNMESFDPLPDITSELLQQFEVDDSDDDEPVKITKLGNPAAQKTPAPEATAATGDEGDPWSHQNLSRFKLDIPEQDVEKDEISIVFDMNDVGQDEPKSDEFLLRRQGEEISRVTARIQIPKVNENSVTQPIHQTQPTKPREQTQAAPAPMTFDATLPQIDTSGFSLEEVPEDTHNGESAFDSRTHRYSPIGEVLHGEAVISQFSGEVDEGASELSLEEDPNDHPPPSTASQQVEYSPYDPVSSTQIAAPSVDAMSVDEVERIVRAQSQEVIEALVRRIVPEIATEIIKKELERLLAEDDLTSKSQSGLTPKGKKS